MSLLHSVIIQFCLIKDKSKENNCHSICLFVKKNEDYIIIGALFLLYYYEERDETKISM